MLKTVLIAQNLKYTVVGLGLHAVI